MSSLYQNAGDANAAGWGQYVPGVGTVQIDKDLKPTGNIINTATGGVSATPKTVTTKAASQYTPYQGLISSGGKYWAKLANPNNQGTYGGYSEITPESVKYYNLDPAILNQLSGLKPTTVAGFDPSQNAGFSGVQKISPESAYSGITWDTTTPYADYLNSQWGNTFSGQQTVKNNAMADAAKSQPPPVDNTVNLQKDANGKYILPSDFDVSKGATGVNSPYLNAQVYGDFFPGATDQTFNAWMTSHGWQGTVPSTKEQFAALTTAQQGLYRSLLAKHHSEVPGGSSGGGNSGAVDNTVNLQKDANGKYILPSDFDVSKGATGVNSPYLNAQVYGDFFPGATDNTFNQWMTSHGWQGSVPSTKEQFFALTTAQQGLYRSLLAKHNAESTGNNNGTQPPAPPADNTVDLKKDANGNWILPSDFDVSKGATGVNSPYLNAQVYGDNYYLANTDKNFTAYLTSKGFSKSVLSKADFDALTPAEQGQYRTLLADYHKNGYTAPTTGGSSGGGGNGSAPGGNPNAGLEDWGQLGDYGFTFPLIPSFDPASIEQNPVYAYERQKLMDETKARLLSQGRYDGTVGNNVMAQASNDLMQKEMETEYNRWLTEQQNARNWGTFGQGENQRQFNNMLSLAQMGQSSASQAAGLFNQTGQNIAQLYDNYGNYVGDQSNTLAKNQADTTRNFVSTQLGLDQANSGTLINLLLGYGGNLAQILTWAADPSTEAALATAQANQQAGTGNALSAMVASYFNYPNKKTS